MDMLGFAGSPARLGLTLVYLALAACATVTGPTQVDPKTGYLPVAILPGIGISKGSVLTNQKVDFGIYQGRVLVTGDQDLRDELAIIGAFEDVFDDEGLQKRVIAAGVQDQVKSTGDAIGISRAYKYYKPFLWMHWEIKDEFGGTFVRMIVTEAGDGRDVFVASIHACLVGGCDDDRDVFYPLFNSFIDWVYENGGTVKTGLAR